MRRLLTTIAALAAIILTVNVDETGVRASHLGGADSFSVDMNPSATPANTATSLGSRQGCARIALNGVQDADEDGIDLLDLDITAANVPSAHPVLGFQYVLNYSEAALTVQASDANFFVSSLSGRQLLIADETVPDADGNNRWSGTAMDPSYGPTAESGSGVLERLQISADTGAASGLYSLTLSDAGHVDPMNDAFAPDILNSGQVAINDYCPLTESDADVVYDADETACKGSVYSAAIRPGRIDGVFAGVSDDGNTAIDEALPAGAQNYDCDGDGYKGSIEATTRCAATVRMMMTKST